jgi:hypothetical protein
MEHKGGEVAQVQAPHPDHTLGGRVAWDHLRNSRSALGIPALFERVFFLMYPRTPESGVGGHPNGRAIEDATALQGRFDRTQLGLDPISMRRGSGGASAPPRTVISSRPFSKSALMSSSLTPAGKVQLRLKAP